MNEKKKKDVYNSVKIYLLIHGGLVYNQMWYVYMIELPIGLNIERR